MGEPQPQSPKSQSHKPHSRALSYEQIYCCPACGCGELSAIALMDVFACNFCRHFFTANLQTQSVQLADSRQPMAWSWNGHRWRSAYQADVAASLLWGFASLLTLLPVTLIALSNYIFPPLEGLESSHFPVIWSGLTLITHALIAGWLLAEYHRWPWYIASGIFYQRGLAAVLAAFD